MGFQAGKSSWMVSLLVPRQPLSLFRSSCEGCCHCLQPSGCSCHLRDGVHRFQADLFFRCGVRDAITSSCLPRAVITWEPRSGTATTSLTGAASAGVPRWPVGVFAVCTAGEHVIMYSNACNHEFPPVMSPAIQASGCVDCAHLRYGSTGCWSSLSPGFRESAIMKFRR